MQLKPDKLSSAPCALGAAYYPQVPQARACPSVGRLKPDRRAGIGLGDRGDGDSCTNGLTDPENTGSRPDQHKNNTGVRRTSYRRPTLCRRRIMSDAHQETIHKPAPLLFPSLFGWSGGGERKRGSWARRTWKWWIGRIATPSH